ncbi:RNA polymerase sigma factor [Myxococcus llanfairpwllgwyngyllgogerychwyrndrobwllllantysiliogogogochensis]|uniref:RNA polymerase sigma factor n=2 Tax=Myxococcus TaxID=32 RepID=A0A540X698_9BACT|nr:MULTISPECIES: RNA polymerase sigma factor [Myxococcus]TQF16742.1 RNA polymerase sigma factor [Myxococcus llanfairpwllgwyngyllgogerychwyrndrobwllllantysiliogogogochensis]
MSASWRTFRVESQPRPTLAASPLSGHELEKLRRELTQAVARVCPPRLANRRDDLVQTAMMRVMELQRREPDRSRLSPSYLYRVAYTALVDELRNVDRRREVPIEEVESLPQQPVASGDPEKSASASQIARAVRDCLRQLAQDRRLAVTLYLQGHTVPEAGELMGWDGKRTENLVYRGLSALRVCLSTKGFEP